MTLPRRRIGQSQVSNSRHADPEELDPADAYMTDGGWKLGKELKTSTARHGPPSMMLRVFRELPWVVKLHQQGMALPRIAGCAGLPQSTVRTWIEKYGHLPPSSFAACDIEIHIEPDGEPPAHTNGSPIELAPPESNLDALCNFNVAAGLAEATTDTPSPLAAADAEQPDGDSTPDRTPRRPSLRRGHLSRVHDEIAGNVRRTTTPVNVPGLQVLADVPSEPVEYLWHERIPLGEITIIEGHPGTNKSS
jgi:hypothetical protein